MASQASSKTAPLLPIPRWLPLTSLLLATAGLVVAGYLTYEHFTASTSLACPETSTVNCQKVTTSEQSHVFGIPVVIYGLLFFVVMLIACAPPLWRNPAPAIRYGRLVFALIGVAFAAYLVYAELFVINAICLWCTAVHLLALLLFGVIAFGTALLPPDTDH
jgi:uncharacterized membrane protein